MAKIEKRLDKLERRVEEVADRDAIRELTARYCQEVVRGNGEGVVGLFTEDATLETHFPGGSRQANVVSEGREQLRKAYTDLDTMQLKPFIHNHVIELDGKRARGFCSVEIRLVQDGTSYIGAGHYEDEYRRVKGEWKFQRRELFVYHWVPLSKGWA